MHEAYFNSSFKIVLHYTTLDMETHPTSHKGAISEVAQSSPTPCDPMDCNLPGSSVHGIFQARVLE